MQIQKSISFEEMLWMQIDQKKGDISRSKFLAKIVKKQLGVKK